MILKHVIIEGSMELKCFIFDVLKLEQGSDRCPTVLYWSNSKANYKFASANFHTMYMRRSL